MLLDYGGTWLVSIGRVLVTLFLGRWVLVTPAALLISFGFDRLGN